MDPELVNFTLERNEMIASKKLNSSTGLYSSYICKPLLVQEDGSAKTATVGMFTSQIVLPLKKGHCTPE